MSLTLLSVKESSSCSCIRLVIVFYSTCICNFVRSLPWWLLFNELMNKACHYSLIVTQFRDRYIQVKGNEIVDSGSQRVTASVIYR